MPLTARWLAVAAVSAVGALFLLIFGPFEVYRASAPAGIEAPFWYMVTAFPVLGLLVAEWLALALRRAWWPAVELAAAVAVMVALSGCRLQLRIPVSGHALLFCYALLRLGWLPVARGPGRRAELALTGLLLVGTSAVKLLLWDDPVTLAVGLALGGLLFGGSFVLARHPPR